MIILTLLGCAALFLLCIALDKLDHIQKDLQKLKEKLGVKEGE